jgi:hypothetical protein
MFLSVIDVFLSKLIQSYKLLHTDGEHVVNASVAGFSIELKRKVNQVGGKEGCE